MLYLIAFKTAHRKSPLYIFTCSNVIGVTSKPITMFSVTTQYFASIYRRVPKKLVRNYQYSLHNNPQERSSQLLCGGSHISRTLLYVSSSPVSFHSTVRLFVCFGDNSPQWATDSSFIRFLNHTQRHTTFGRTPLDEWSVRRRDLYLTTHNTHNRQTSVPLVGFEPPAPTGEQPQTDALDRAATGTGDRTLSSTYCL